MALTKADIGQIKDIMIEAFGPRFNQIDSWFNKADSRFDAIDSRLDRIDESIEHLALSTQKQFEAMGKRFDRLEEDMGAVKDIVSDHHYRIAKLERRVTG